VAAEKSGLGTEVRVGLLVLAAIVLLGGFVFVLGGVRLEGGRTIYVDFDNPGNVKPGAPVAVGGIRIGSVEEVEYRGNRLDPETNTRALIRMRLSIQDDVADTIHEDALFYVTALSVLGEQMIAVDPGTVERPVLPEGSVVRGIDPPRLDLALALGYELLEAIVEVLRENREELKDLLGNLAGIVRALHEILVDHRESIDRMVVNIERATEDAAGLASSARGVVEGPEVRRIVDNLDRTLVQVARDIGPILEETRGAVTSANETLDAIGPEERERIQGAIADAAELAERANSTVAEAQEIVHHVREGQGTIGALVMDEEIYDDLQEMLRDLKHNPWKFFWRE
jgi:phospholipid/cholesterol/gamma-HCH transport system substrate-binding protein